jgi:hypothetical protein
MQRVKILIGMVLLGAAPATARAQLSEDASEAARKLVVVVRGSLDGTDVLGGGLIVGMGQDRLFIATANHVVRQGVKTAERLRVRFRWLPESFEASLLEDVDPTLDLAVLSVRGLAQLAIGEAALSFDQLGDVRATKRGAPVYSVGHPRGTLWRIGVTPERVSQISGEAILFESSVLLPGHSGGGLVDDHGRLLGMIRKDLQPDGDAVIMDRVIERLREWNYPIALKPPAVRTTDAGAGLASGGTRVAALDAHVSGLRFFESVKGFPPQSSRTYQTRFATRGIEYVNWEIGLEYQAPAQRRDFTIDEVWYCPNGEVCARQAMNAYMEPGWTSSFHADGRGSDAGGSFQPGVYRVELSIAGQPVASGTFEVYDGDAPPSMYVQAIDAKVTAVRFFESGFDSPPPEQRVYRDRFPRSGTRYIDWELMLTFPKAPKRIDFAIRHVWVRPDGSRENDQTLSAYIDAGWSSSQHTQGWGRAEGGIWQPGTYRVDFYVDGRIVASGTFSIDP